MINKKCQRSVKTVAKEYGNVMTVAVAVIVMNQVVIVVAMTLTLMILKTTSRTCPKMNKKPSATICVG